MFNPRINPAVLLSPVEEGYVAYDPMLDRLHQLNPIAALLTELCNGSHSVDEIRELVGPLLPEGKNGEIDRWIDDAMKVGLLVAEGDGATRCRELTAEELSTLTKRLKETGGVQAAYLCGKRTVELKPDDWTAWYNLGDIAQCLGRREEACAAYQKYFDANRDDGEIEHLLIALRDEAPPPRASDRAIRHIYKNFAGSYETRMLDDLRYAGPQRMQDAIKTVIGDRRGLAILDLGCGSGLAGLSMKEYAGKLVGIDLSPEMIALAKARNIYRELEVAEITHWLDQGDELFDIIMGCDCLIYFGDLRQVVEGTVKRLKPGGIFALSVERGNHYPYRLTDTGRYTHHPDHVRALASDNGLIIAHMNESFLRLEYGEDVVGLFAVLSKSSQDPA